MAVVSMTSLLPRAARTLLASSIAVGAWLAAAPAFAADAAIPIHLVVDRSAAPACAAADDFFAEVRAVEPRAERDESESAPRAEVRYAPRASGGFRGDLRITNHGEALVRSAEGKDCADVTRALALVVALQASEAKANAPRTEAATTEAVPVSQTREPETPDVSAPTAVPTVVHGFFIGGGIRTGVVSTEATPSVSVGYILEARKGQRAIALRAGVQLAQERTDLLNVRVVTSVIDACPVVLGSRASLMFAPCVRGEFGVKSVSARYNGSGELAPWSDIGAAVTLTKHIAGGLTIELDGAALKALSRTDFVVSAPSFGSELRASDAAPTPSVVLTAGLSLGWSFFPDLSSTGGPR